LAAVFTVGLLAPWMVSMYQSCGTPFYPLLGLGYHAAPYGQYQPSSTVLNDRAYLFRSFVAFCLDRTTLTFCLLTAAAWMGGLLHRRRRPNLWAIVLAVAVGALAILLGAGFNPYRFALAFLLAAVLVLLSEVFRSIRDADPAHASIARNMLILACIAAGVWVGGGGPVEVALQFRSRNAVTTAKAQSPAEALRSPALQARYAAMQDSVPPGDTILCRLEKPYLLNFKRNPVYIVDYAGGLSLPPGMPFFKGGQKLADYLLGLSIRYVAYSYATHAMFAREQYSDRLGPGYHAWLRLEAKYTFDFQDSLDELRKSHRLLYDDGDICLIDLAQPK
jgi:hypothetical protein